MVDMDELFNDKPPKRVSSSGYEGMDDGTKIDVTASLGQMSSNVIDVMKVLANNKGIRALLYIDEDNPMDMQEHGDNIPTSGEILGSDESKKRISPVSFNMNAQVDDRTEIRVYYNVGRFDKSGTEADYNMHIDIICAKNLWLIRDPLGESKIRPYEIMSRIFDLIGHNNIHDIKIGRPVQFQMLSVNEAFDAIRIYYNTYDVMGDVHRIRER